MKKSLLLIITIITALTIYAQSPVGKWKAGSSYSITQNGKKVDFEITASEKACMAKKIYHFTADGKISTSGGECPGANNTGSDFSTWKMAGKDKITITWDDKDLDPETFQLEIIGNKMRWIKNYPDDPDVSNDQDFKQVVIEYVKA
jgi:hypothetical protein